jgi:hypothetical protein
MAMGWTLAGLSRAAARLAFLLPLILPVSAQSQSSSQLDARKELASLGITWSAENFRLAVFRKDYHAVELFLKGGIDPHTDSFYNPLRGLSLLTVFSVPGNFDPTIGKLLISYPTAIKPAEDCPATSLPGSFGDQFDIYTNALTKPELASFLRFFCNRPDVITKIDERIAELKSQPAANAKLLKGWLNAKSFLTGLPSELPQPQAQAQAVKSTEPAVSSPARLTPATNIDIATLDVAGVKLGMTADEAIAGLKNFDPGLAVKRRYLTGPSFFYGSDGKDLTEIYEADKSTSYFNDLYATKGATKRECDNTADRNRLLRCSDRHIDDEEVIKVWFSPIPGQERVIAVQRSKTFYKDPKPAVASLRDGVFAKYSREQNTYEIQRGWVGTVGWLFDSKKRIISSAAAKSKRIETTGGLPGSVNPGDGIALNVVFNGNSGNNQIADSVLVTLSDGDALNKSVEQAKATYAALKAQVDAKQIEKATKSSNQTKF